MQTFKKMDLAIIFFMFILSFIPNLVFYYKSNKNFDSVYAEIKIDGEIYDKINLSYFKDGKTLDIKTKQGYNTISIKNGTISIIDSDCYNSVCVNHGETSKVGDSIICLPHKLIIEIKGDKKDSSSDMILSH